jgi:hypothetical protein
MPIARFEMPDGRIGRFEVPEGTTAEDAQSMVEQYLSQNPKFDTAETQPKIPKNEQSFTDSMVLGAKKRALGIAELGVNALDYTGIAPDAAKSAKSFTVVSTFTSKNERGW